MKFHTEYLTFETSKHREYLKITPQVRRVLEKSGIDLGPWQEVYYAEFDGKRPKRVIMKGMGE